MSAKQQAPRYKVANFVEVDDLSGGRKIVMVGADGITGWDVIDVEAVTPIMFHPVFKPVDLGGFMEFVDKHVLVDVVRKVMPMLGDAKSQDRLFLMRVLVAYTRRKDAAQPLEQALADAIDAAKAEEQRALEMHNVLGAYQEAVERDGGKSA